MKTLTHHTLVTQVVNPTNVKARMDFLRDCAAGGMPAHQVNHRRATTEHLVRLAGATPFAEFDIGQLNALIKRAVNMANGKPLSAQRLRKVFDHGRELFDFLREEQPAKFRHVKRRHLDNLRASTAGLHMPANLRRPFYDLDEVKRLAAFDPGKDLLLRRARAMACLQFLGGMRVGAVATLPLTALDLEHLRVHQWTDLGVRTKGSKNATTALLNLPDLLAPVQEWFDQLASELRPEAMFFNVFANCDPPALSNHLPGRHRGIALADDYELLCQHAEVTWKGSHAFRHGHVLYCARRCRTPTDFMALSQNVMHADDRMTRLYAMLETGEVSDTYRNFASARPTDIAGALEQLHMLLSSGHLDTEQRSALKRLAADIVVAL